MRKKEKGPARLAHAGPVQGGYISLKAGRTAHTGSNTAVPPITTIQAGEEGSYWLGTLCRASPLPDGRASAMDKQILVELMFGFGASAAGAAIATVVMVLVR